MIYPDPKPPRPIRLTGKAYTEFRKQVYERDNGLCKDCGEYAPLLWNGVFNEYLCGHVSHIRSHGVGGSDILSNVQWKCFCCHRAKHDGRGAADSEDYTQGGN